MIDSETDRVIKDIPIPLEAGEHGLGHHGEFSKDGKCFFLCNEHIKDGGFMNKTKALANSAIVLYFIIGLEIMIMISPFAGFFYSVFDPFLLATAKYPSTKWLSGFFLPHMVVCNRQSRNISSMLWQGIADFFEEVQVSATCTSEARE
ncbi:MAG TPA: hypothetical protein VFG09_12380 [Thermodesulfovibrionales bacterium]|nr:hypothetical protein [Thermodesulfovibrionales bacterium]